MHTKTVLTFAAALIGAASAIAGDVTPDYPMAYTSTVSRANVLADARQARAAGQIAVGELNVVINAPGMPLSRAQVKAETLEAIRLGLIGSGEKNVLPTDEQNARVHMAGLQALSMTVAAR